MPKAMPVSDSTDFGELHEAFEQAAQSKGDVRHYFRIGPKVICLRFAGNALVTPLSAALEHRAIAAAQPDLTILCYENASFSLPYTAHPDIRSYYAPGVPSLNLYNPSQKLAMYCVERADVVPYWETSFPFRHLLHWFFADSPFQMVHAGAVGTEKGGVLLTGKGGSGKSTTALACLTSPLSYAGDDFVLVGNAPGSYAYNLFNTAKLVPDNVNRLPHFQGKMSNADALETQKALFFLNKHYPEKISPGFPIKAIFLPRVTDQKKTCLTPASGAQTLLALAPTSLMHLEGDSRLALDKMSMLVRSVPHYWLELGSDIQAIPGVIADFLETAP